MYDDGGKLMSGIKSTYVDSLTCVRVKGVKVNGLGWGETRVYHVPLAVQCIYGWNYEGGENEDAK